MKRLLAPLITLALLAGCSSAQMTGEEPPAVPIATGEEVGVDETEEATEELSDEERFLWAFRARYKHDDNPDEDHALKLGYLACREVTAGRVESRAVSTFVLEELRYESDRVTRLVVPVAGSWEKLCPEWYKG